MNNHPDSSSSGLPLPDSSTLPTIRLDQFLKAHRVVESGGQAKLLIQRGEVFVNGMVETRRSKKLVEGDIVGLDGEDFCVEFEP